MKVTTNGHYAANHSDGRGTSHSGGRGTNRSGRDRRDSPTHARGRRGPE
jgi:hypothetical protein